MDKKLIFAIIICIIILVSLFPLLGCGGCCGPEAAEEKDDDTKDEDEENPPGAPVPGTPPDVKAPVISPSIPAQTVPVGGTRTLVLSNYVGSTGGSDITWTLESSDSGTVRVSGAGNSFTLEGVQAGSTSLVATLTNEAGRSASQTVAVTVS